MTAEAPTSSEFLAMVDYKNGLVGRKMFSDEEIYRLELERIFDRAWNFMAHESQVRNPGDFFQSYIGEDRVIAVRDKDGDVQVLLNTCRHRGNAVCRAEEGHATSFMCTYHGWTYDLAGNLIGVPGFKEFYHERLAREDWGLQRAAKVATYGGFIFATMDPEAPELEDYLGDVGRIGLTYLSARGDMAVVGGIQKYIIGCNWKFAVDNVWDYYHGVTHMSAFITQSGGRSVSALGAGGAGIDGPSLVMLGEYGHAIGGPMGTEARPGQGDSTWKESAEAKEALGPVGLKVAGHPHIFPNLWVTNNQVSLRIPRGPDATEIWWFTLLDRNLPAEKWDVARQAANHTFGPAGMLEQEDGENWDQSTRGARGVAAQRLALNYQMNLGQSEVVEDELGPPRIETPHVTEHPQLWTWRAWSEWMAASSWPDLKANHSPSPSGFI